jgi:DNA-3-methyladenine glycosylase I
MEKAASRSGVPRCEWALGSPILTAYHDHDWGVPVRDDRLLFELLTLEGAQAGLSWETILRKREGYRAVFLGFDPEKVARFDARKLRQILQDSRIVRNRLKVESTVVNARRILAVQGELGSFSEYIWRFVGGKPIRNSWRLQRELPAATPESRRMSKDLRARGFRFVGPTVCYAFMQAAGLVDDHVVGCFRYQGRGKPPVDRTRVP